MPDWKKLEADILQFNELACDLPEGLSEVQQSALKRHNHFVVTQLLNFTRLSLPDSEKETIFRLFFEIRWRVINNSSVDYTLNPFLPANQACLAVAGAIAKEDEAVCQILMPSVTAILGSAFSPDAVKDASEVEGRFLPANHLVRLDGKALFSVLDFYSLITGNTALFFSSEEGETPAFHFSAEDTQRIRDVAGKSSQHYFDEIQRIHCSAQGETPSLGYQLQVLQKALYRSSKERKGSEEVADISECRQPILNFARLWFPLLDHLKTDVASRRAHGSSLPLGSYLLCLFAYTEGVSLEEADYERVRQEEIIECTHQIALQISSVLKQHPDLFDVPLLSVDPLFEKLEMAGKEKRSLHPSEIDTLFAEWDVFFHQLETGDYSTVAEKPLPDKETLALMLTELERGLEKRPALRGFNDVTCLAMLPVFERLSVHCIDQESFALGVIHLADAIRTIEAMRNALRMLPVSYWSLLISHISPSAILEMFQLRDASSNYEYLLSDIPSAEWPAFFNALRHRNMLFSASTLGVLFYSLPALELPVLIDALGEDIHTVLSDGDDLFYLLAASFFTNWERVITLLYAPIENILKNPKHFAAVFLQFQFQEKTFLMERLGEMIPSLVTHVSFLERVLEDLPVNQRLLFLKLISPFLKKMTLTEMGLIRVLQLCRSVDFPGVMKALKAVGAFDFFKSDIDLVFLLTHFNEVNRIVVLSETPPDFFSFKITVKGLCFLIGRFPECTDPLLRLFRRQLPGMLNTFFGAFALADDFENDIHPTYVSTFRNLLPKILPVILSDAFLKSISVSYDIATPSFFSCTDPVVYALHLRVCEIEKAVRFGEITSDQGIMQKIRLLSDFMRPSENTSTFHGMFYDDLASFFGKDFFTLLEKAIARFHLFTAVGIPNPLSLMPYYHAENFEDTSSEAPGAAGDGDAVFMDTETDSNASTMSLL